jgi:hypothetical protein
MLSYFQPAVQEPYVRLFAWFKNDVQKAPLDGTNALPLAGVHASRATGIGRPEAVRVRPHGGFRRSNHRSAERPPGGAPNRRNRRGTTYGSYAGGYELVQKSPASSG